MGRAISNQKQLMENMVMHRQLSESRGDVNMIYSIGRFRQGC